MPIVLEQLASIPGGLIDGLEVVHEIIMPNLGRPLTLAIMDVRVIPADLHTKEVLRQLLEFNAYEFAAFFEDSTLDEHGRFGYRWLDHYWTEPDRHPYLIRVGDQIGGMTLVRGGDHLSIAEFLIMPQYRRHGVGRIAARQVFDRFSGDWTVHQVPGNDRAVAFWRRAIPVPFSETVDGDGTTQRFTLPG